MKVISKKTHTRNKAIIPKMICGIIATISIAVIGFLSLSPFWFWTCLEIIAGLLVAGGCWGEWYLFKNPPDEGNESAKYLHHSREVRCIIAVAIGVTVEFAALAHSIPEAARLEKDVAQIGTTNAQLSMQVAQLVSTNLVLQREMQPRTITPKHANDFIELIKKDRNVQGLCMQVCTGSSIGDNETMNYAEQISEMLVDAGFCLLPMLHGTNDFYYTRLRPDGSLRYIFYNYPNKLFEKPIGLEWKNGVFFTVHTYCPEKELVTNIFFNRFMSVKTHFEQIGINTSLVIETNDVTFPLELTLEIYVPQKVY